ncbi:MAG: hypothetical protein Q4Q22_08975, partial [Methanosphaera sp.]|nr:hypothetical protein [Methanosphaera sp.]
MNKNIILLLMLFIIGIGLTTVSATDDISDSGMLLTDSGDIDGVNIDDDYDDVDDYDDSDDYDDYMDLD